jgi:acyl carrier protein
MLREEIILIVKDELEAIAKKSINDLDEDIFFKSRFLDSLNMLNLIIFIECRFNIRLESFFIDREKVSSINKITDYIEKELTQR